MLSGEAHYRLEREDREPYYESQRQKHQSLEKFFTYLDDDVSLKAQTRVYSNRLAKIRANKGSFLRSYRQRCKLEADLLVILKRINTKKKIETVRSISEQLKIGLQKERSTLDSFLMDSVLRYFSLLREELRRTHELLLADKREGDQLRHEASVLRDLRVLAKHLEVETKERVSLTLLAPDSVQSQRCRNAVKENFVPPPSASGTAVEARVLSVFKIDHKVLSAQLQHAASTVEHGNIKGLFCYVPREALAAFCVFGLHSQHFCGVDGVGALKAIFRLPWFCPSNSAQNTPNLPQAEAAARNHSINKLTYYFGKQSLSIAPTTSTKGGNSENKKDSNRCSYDDAIVGVMIALCRVLICRPRTVGGDISEYEISESRRLGFDALYSTKTEEYVLLRPEFVLPEFIMNVHVVPDTAAAPKGKAPKVKSWMPPVLDYQYDCPSPSRQGGAINSSSVSELLCGYNNGRVEGGRVSSGGPGAMAEKQALVSGIERALHSCRQRFSDKA